MKNLKSQISKIIASKPTLNLFFALKTDEGLILKRADIESEEAAPELCQMHINQLNYLIIENEDVSLIDLSSADDRTNAIYKYDYADYPEELEVIHDFKIEEAIKLDSFNFSNDDISQLFAFVIYIGDMENGILLFKKHYPVTMIKRGTFLLFKRGERLVKFDDADIFRMNGDFNIFRVNDQLYIKDLSVLEKNCGFEELIKERASSVLDIINDRNLVENITDLSEAAEDISYARKLSKIYKKSPVINKKIPNEQIIDFCKKNPGLKKAFKYSADGKRFILDSKSSQQKFLKLLNDDYLISELTKSYYDSIAKDSIETGA
jgi:hypothetical protein